MKFLTHDGLLYFWNKVKNYIDTGLSGKAATSHGNHVPTIQSANNQIFLRNDNTWQTVTPSNIGAAASSHTHTKSQITDFPTSLPANGGNADSVDGLHFLVVSQSEYDGLSSDWKNNSSLIFMIVG